MFEVTVETHFAAAHHLLHYQGSCENPHGHNWVVQVSARGHELDKANILIDYKILKKELNKIIDELDHTDLNENPDFNGESPSSEFLTRYIYYRLKPHVPTITNVTVYETPTSKATYWE